MSEVETAEAELEQETETDENEVEQEVEVEPNYIENFIDNVVDGSNSAAKEDFENAMALKVTAALDAQKQGVANNFFNQEVEDESTEQDDQS